MKDIKDCDGLDCRNLAVIDELEAEKKALLAACEGVLSHAKRLDRRPSCRICLYCAPDWADIEHDYHCPIPAVENAIAQAKGEG